MNAQEIYSAIAELTMSIETLEALYNETDGEVTAETEQREAVIENIKALLTGEGIDSLGRWLAQKEATIKILKKEKDSITRQMNSVNRVIDYIKGIVNDVLKATGQEKVKGTCYSFSAYTSKTTEINKDILKALYAERVDEARIAAHIPPYITLTIGASSAKAEELGVIEGDEEIFIKSETPSCRFIKPRESK